MSPALLAFAVMSSITTAVPSGLIATSWCLQELLDHDNNLSKCANSSLGQTTADFETICCDGDIVDTTQDLYNLSGPRKETSIDLDNLVCCGVHGPQAGGFGPPINLATACTEGRATPLVRLAATNTGNAALYAATFTSASFGMTVTGDYIPTETPTCLWAYTKTGVKMRNITVKAADITTLPPSTTDQYGRPIFTTTTMNDGRARASREASLSAANKVTADASSSGATTSSATSLRASRRILPYDQWKRITLSSILLGASLCIPLVLVG